MIGLWLALAGGVGAVARFMLDGAVRRRWPTDFPFATLLINVTGSFALGLLAGAVAAHHLGPEALLIAGTGFLGGYTTFSTASLETVRLLHNREPLRAVLYGIGGAGVCLLAAWAGILLG
ncbi:MULTISPECIES: fluoride efflux transporter CrcB [Arthrobacter]|uniref:Fluoride-specific ion channel FluC n=2 Tax=Arthrobacter TaxID=1663 RepID=A0ABU9KJF9_9MICC|nr:fluoride efflux transporter CrcB [Arthrobacter sp. YJM1]MDP5226788.1 fluoride efflux transporter CrcB [Arthrobacter sp. YJM1]